MATAAAPDRSKQTLSFAEYIEKERLSDTKHHYYYGRLIEVAGATYKHNVISGNLIASIGSALVNSGCIVLPSDMRIFVSQDVVYYPDVVVVGAKPMVTFGDALQNPMLIAEIVSPSTAAFDRGEKFRQYRTIASLRHYLLPEQDRPFIEHYEWAEAGAWTLRGEYDALEQTLEMTISEHRISLPLSKIYRNVTFPAVAPSATDPTEE